MDDQSLNKIIVQEKLSDEDKRQIVHRFLFFLKGISDSQIAHNVLSGPVEVGGSLKWHVKFSRVTTETIQRIFHERCAPGDTCAIEANGIVIFTLERPALTPSKGRLWIDWKWPLLFLAVAVLWLLLSSALPETTSIRTMMIKLVWMLAPRENA
jgi:hypothetical protein